MEPHKTRRLLFASRLIQIIFSTLGAAFAITLCLYEPSNFGYNLSYDESVPLFLLVPILVLCICTLLMGYIGMFAFKRPNDVHWHMMLSLDWLTLVAGIANGVMSVLSIFWSFDVTIAFYVLLIISTWLPLFAILVPVIRTHRLAAHKLLPPPNSRKETWYNMEDEARSPYATYAVPQAPAAVERQGHVSRADTTARWSGNSAADTNVFSSSARKSDAEVVPPYSAASVGSPRLSMQKEGLRVVE